VGCGLRRLRRGWLKWAGGWQILTDIWGPASTDHTHYLRVYLAQLRRKLEPDPSHPRYLITEPGLGYRFRFRLITARYNGSSSAGLSLWRHRGECDGIADLTKR